MGFLDALRGGMSASGNPGSMSFAPGEDEWQRRLLMSNPVAHSPQGQGLFANIGDSLKSHYQANQAQGGLMGGMGAGGKQDMLMAMGASMLANSGPSPERKSFGQIVGEALQAGGQVKKQRQAYDASQQEAADIKEYRKKQLELEDKKANQAQPVAYGTMMIDPNTHEVVAQNDRLPGGGSDGIPMNVKEYEYFKGLNPAERAKYLEVKRAIAWNQQMVNGVPNMSVQTPNGGGGFTTNPLSTPETENAAAQANAQAKAAGTAFGTAQGTKDAGGMRASDVIGILDEADALLPKATASPLGAVRDTLMGVVGKSTDAGDAAQSLKVLEGNLMMAQPRLEGPQGQKDAELYQRMAGLIGDAKIPLHRRQGAIRTIRNLAQRHAAQFAARKAELQSGLVSAPQSISPGGGPPPPQPGSAPPPVNVIDFSKLAK